jgi:serine/threonine protein kinase
VFISKKKVKIGDFGFAKKNSEGLKNHTAVGTPLYMPVELLKGNSYTSKCDIWAIGFIFYEMLHGRTPWTAKSEYELINNIETKPLKI